MTRRRRFFAAGLAAVAVLALAAGVALAAGTDDDSGEQDTPITGPVLDQASRVALDHVGQGRVTETEVGDEDSYYEIEVTLDDGSQVDVQLDEDLDVVSSEPDREDRQDDDAD